MRKTDQLKNREGKKMMINAMLLVTGLFLIPAAICAHTELTCRTAA